MIDLAALTSLRAVDTHGSVVGAADALGFTPSAISQQVKRLEKQTGVPLLERVGRGVILTDHGRHLVDAGTRLLADLEEVESGLHERAGTVAGHLRLTAFSTAMRGLVAPVVRDLLSAHPDLSLTLTEREPWDTIDLVEEGWIATPEGTICRQWLTRMYAGTGRLPRIAHTAMEFDSHLALVGAGLGIALVPRLGRQPLGDQLVAVPAHDPEPTRDVIAVHRRSMAESPAIKAVLAALSS
jgi:DNA-binding transcriptional LysR family regulator